MGTMTLAAESRSMSMTSTTMTYDQLCLSPFNPRKNKADIAATAAMEKSLAARGQIMPLVVHQMRGSKTKWGVVIGGRRYRSIGKLIARGEWPAAQPIAVVVRDLSEADLIEIGTEENVGRINLRPYEVFLAVTSAHRRGDSPAKIADGLGQSILWVRQCLRLAALAPPIFDALEAETITVDQARAYAATEDHALQLSTFRTMAEYPEPLRSPAKIRAHLRVGDHEEARLLRFVGADKYRDAGGTFELDLFAEGEEEERGRVADVGLLRQLVDHKLQGLKDETRRRVGRDVRFAPEKPRGEFRVVDQSLQITPIAGDGDTIEVPEGDIFAVITIPDSGVPELTWWWVSRKAKFGIPATGRPTSPRPAPTAIGSAIGYSGSPDARDANGAIKDEEGLSQEGVEILRSVRRAIMRAALVDDARRGGTIAQDLLVWSQLRLILDQRAYSTQLGITRLASASAGPESSRAHIAAAPAMQPWAAALHEFSETTMIRGDDQAAGFADYCALPPEKKLLAAALVAGFALERSLNADGYRLPVHDAIARMTGLDSDTGLRRYWTPTAAFLDLIPTKQRLAIAEPFVERVAFATWSRMKSAELTRNVLAALAGTGEWLRTSTRHAAASWVHPLLQFAPIGAAEDADQLEAAE